MGNGLTRAAFRTEVPEYGDGLLAFVYFAVLHCLDEGIFRIERPCLPGKL